MSTYHHFYGLQIYIKSVMYSYLKRHIAVNKSTTTFIYVLRNLIFLTNRAIFNLVNYFCNKEFRIFDLPITNFEIRFDIRNEIIKFKVMWVCHIYCSLIKVSQFSSCKSYMKELSASIRVKTAKCLMAREQPT